MGSRREKVIRAALMVSRLRAEHDRLSISIRKLERDLDRMVRGLPPVVSAFGGDTTRRVYVELLAIGAPVRVSTLSDRLMLPNKVVHNAIRTLHRQGRAVRGPSRGWWSAVIEDNNPRGDSTREDR